MNAHFLYLDAVDTLRRRRYALLVPLVVFMAAAAGIAFLTPATYESSGTLLLRQGTEQLRNGADPAAASLSRFALLDEILRNRTTYEILLDSLGWKAGAGEERERVLSGLEEHAAGEQRGPEMYSITVRDADPARAGTIATALTGVVLAAVTRTELNAYDSTIAYLSRKVATYTPGRSEAEPPGLSGAGDAQALRLTLARTEAELGSAETEQEANQRELTEIRTLATKLDDAAAVKRFAAARGGGPALTELRTLAARYADLLGRYTPRYPEVQAVRRQLVARIDRHVNAAEREAGDLAARIGQLRSRRAWARTQLASGPAAGDPPAVGTEREASVTRRLRDDLSLQLEQVRVMRDLRAGAGNSLVVLEAPSTPLEPVSPDRPVIMAVGALAGVLAGLLALLIAESMDPTVRRQRDLKTFEKPIIAYFT